MKTTSHIRQDAEFRDVLELLNACSVTTLRVLDGHHGLESLAIGLELLCPRGPAVLAEQVIRNPGGDGINQATEFRQFERAGGKRNGVAGQRAPQGKLSHQVDRVYLRDQEARGVG